MKRFIKNIFLFLLVLITVYPALLYFWGSSYMLSVAKQNMNYRFGTEGFLHTRLNEVKNFKNVDILFLGSSHCIRGFDTRIFSKAGYSSFNLGSSAQTPYQTKVLLERYLDSIQPKMVVYEVYPNTLMLDGVESGTDVIANDKNDLKSISMVFEINHIKTYNTLLYGFMRDALKTNVGLKEPLQRGTETYISGGYVERKMKVYKPNRIAKKLIDIPNKNQNAFKEAAALIKSRNIPLLLIFAPVSNNLYSSYLKKQQFDSLMVSHANYHNFNPATFLSDTIHFYDKDHLNQKGVERFNEEFLNKVDIDSILSISESRFN